MRRADLRLVLAQGSAPLGSHGCCEWAPPSQPRGPPVPRALSLRSPSLAPALGPCPCQCLCQSPVELGCWTARDGLAGGKAAG